MKLNKSKKGFIIGWEYIVSFFVLAVLFVFTAGYYDLMIEEVYYPINDVLDDSLSNQIENYESSVHYTNLNDNRNNIKDNTIPFNLLFMFLFLYSIIASIQNVVKEKRQEPTNLVFKTIGGMIFLLFVVQKFLFEILDWFNVQVLNALFEDLVISYIPFYLTLLENAGIVILLWGGVLIIANWYFGNDGGTTQ